MGKTKSFDYLTGMADPRRWDDREITSEEVRELFRVNGCMVDDGFFDFALLFALKPAVCEILAKQLASKLARIFHGREEPLPDIAVGSVLLGHEVAKALGMKFLSDLCVLDKRLRNLAEGNTVLRVYNTLFFSSIIGPERSDFKGLSLSPVVAACASSGELEIPDGVEVVSLINV